MLDEIGRIDNEKDLRLGKDFCLYQYLADCERNIIRYALYIADNNQSVASRLLGIKPTTLNVKIKRYKICGTAPENPSKRALAGQKRRSRRQG
jgi:DNA-binding NtrC family response regulator